MNWTEQLLFEYYLVSSVREEAVASHFPFYLEEQVWLEMQDAAQVLNTLVLKLIQQPNLLHVEPFPLIEQILGLQTPLLPFFWVRFDAFVRPNGGIFFSEFNYDKPCAQREILFNNLINPQGNPNTNFPDDFVSGLQELWTAYRANHTVLASTPLPAPTHAEQACTPVPAAKPTVGILVDPNHYEELHLAYLYKDLLEPAGFPCLIAGGKNFQVVNNQACAFDQPVDILLRQYPTEHSQEIDNYPQLLELYAAGRLLLVNDPRAILGQGKALFAVLWELVEQNSELLTAKECAVIRATIPRTWIYSPVWQEQLLAEKDAYVLKGNYSRYSEEVYIGQLYTQEEWVELLAQLEASSKTHVVQEFCSSAPWAVRFANDRYAQDTMAYGNFGVYLINNRVSGLCARWSTDLLTSDEAWFSPVGIRSSKLTISREWAEQPEKRRQLWREINDQAAFQCGYTGGYTAGREAFSLSYLALPNSLQQELFQASESFLQLFKQVLQLVQAQPELLCPVLGISEALTDLVRQRQTSSLGLLGRLDWVIDHLGKAKLLEYNAETPAGLLESTELQRLIAARAWHADPNTNNPNQQLEKLIQTEFQRIIADFAEQRDIKTIGFVSTSVNEDWYHTRSLMKCVQHLPYQFVYGEISGLRAEGEQLWLYDTPLDAVYRYYPLDWLADFPGVYAALAKGTLSINPVHTYILQSKAFLALIYQLADQGFFTAVEQQLIQRYIPRTSLRPPSSGAPFVLKPYFEREGQGISFSEELAPQQLAELLQQDVVFQERVFLQQFVLDTYSPHRCQQLPVYPVLGVFTVGVKAAGIYTRAGAKVTGPEAVFLPTLVL